MIVPLRDLYQLKPLGRTRHPTSPKAAIIAAGWQTSSARRTHVRLANDGRQKVGRVEFRPSQLAFTITASMRSRDPPSRGRGFV